MKTIFGPVPSRRLGRSLGIDVIPAKTCTYDCVYCESGPTTHLTIRRHSFIDPGRVMHDLESYFHDYPQGADVLTFSSAGEPTLYEPLGQLLGDIKRRFPQLPLVVLTNGSLLWDPCVRRDLSAADRVVPSLDAATLDVFRRVNRPHPKLDLARILEGLQAFRKEFRKQLYLEIMLVAEMNDHAEELLEMRRLVDGLRPDRIELNTVVRPPAYGYARGLSGRAMEEVLRFFPVETSGIIGCFEGAAPVMDSQDLPSRVLELVHRRPCTLPEMAASLGDSLESLRGTLLHLLQENQLVPYRFNDAEYYRPAPAGK